jgi:hypothetical protein
MHAVIGITNTPVQLQAAGYPANKGTKTNPLYQTIDMDMIAVHTLFGHYFLCKTSGWFWC